MLFLHGERILWRSNSSIFRIEAACGIDSLRRAMEELIKASSSGAAVESIRMDILRIGDDESDPTRPAEHEPSCPLFEKDDRVESDDDVCDESDHTRPAEHEPSCPLFEKDDRVASDVCKCCNVSPFYPAFDD